MNNLNEGQHIRLHFVVPFSRALFCEVYYLKLCMMRSLSFEEKEFESSSSEELN